MYCFKWWGDLHLITTHALAQLQADVRLLLCIFMSDEATYFLQLGSTSWLVCLVASTQARRRRRTRSRSSGQSCGCPMWISRSRNSASWTLISVISCGQKEIDMIWHLSTSLFLLWVQHYCWVNVFFFVIFVWINERVAKSQSRIVITRCTECWIMV